MGLGSAAQDLNADNEIQLLLFIWRKLAPTESSCDLGKWKLLSLRRVLEDWKQRRMQSNLFFGLRSLEYIETQLPGGQLDIIIYVAVLSETHFLVLLCVGG